jgi:polysaccharide biosynthesis transport protein
MLRYYFTIQRQWLLSVIIFILIMGGTIVHSLSTHRHSQDSTNITVVKSHPLTSPHLLLSGLMSAFIASAAAIAVDRWQRHGISAANIVKQLGYPLLGVIPEYRSAPGAETPLWFEDNSIGLLHSNLGWIKKNEHSPHLVVISSLQPQEGKSTIAANLAVISARMQWRVLLVDANFRSPHQHQIWQVNNEMGLSTILMGTSQLAESVVEIFPKLELLPTGVLANSSEILWNTDILAQLVTQWRQVYDVIIVDSPALTTGVDANLLSKLADGLVLVVQPDKVQLDLLQARQSYLNNIEEQILGIVINALDRTEKPNFVTERALLKNPTHLAIH